MTTESTDGPAVVLFTRDLRVHDHPALTAAVEAGDADGVVCLFVLDPRILDGPFAAPNRLRLLADALEDLDTALQDRGNRLVVRRGDPAEEVADVVGAIGARSLHLSRDVSVHAARRTEAIREALDARGDDAAVDGRAHPGVTVVAPGTVTPASSASYRVYTPYWKAWLDHRPRWRDVLDAPNAVPAVGADLAAEIDGEDLRTVLEELRQTGEASPELQAGGERAARERVDAWFGTDDAPGGIADYETSRDDLAADATSRLSADLHLGTVSPRWLAERCDLRRTGHEAFLRQLCWRDFHHQVAAALTADGATVRTDDIRTKNDDWRDDEDALEAWQQGRTGYPTVDAGMRQLLAEGFMHNRARMIVASLLAKSLYLDWRLGADWFGRWLVDGDIANNWANWQWVAGTGTDSRPNRFYNPTRQSERYDPKGAYIRRWIPELADCPDEHVHEPWEWEGREESGYPAPIVDHDAARQRFLEARGKG